MRNIIISTLVLVGILTGCSARQPQYRIGVSQCLDDAWRQKMNDEMERELLLHPGMRLSHRIAYGNNELQCAQIDSFIAERVDLLIVSPIEAEAVKPAVSRAYRADIPVIVADRRVSGNEWTTFIGGDCNRLYIKPADNYKRSTPVSAREIELRTRFRAVSIAVAARAIDLNQISTDQAAFLAQKDQPGGKKTMKKYLWSLELAKYDQNH